jgi:hypothetical protein
VRIALEQIGAAVLFGFPHIGNVPVVPTHKHVHLFNRGDGNMQGIVAFLWRQNAGIDVMVGQLLSIWRSFKKRGPNPFKSFYHLRPVPFLSRHDLS